MTSKNDRPYRPDKLKSALLEVATRLFETTRSGSFLPAHRGAIAGNLEQCWKDKPNKDKIRRAFTMWVFGWSSFNDAPEQDLLALARWLKARSYNGVWAVSDLAIGEASLAWRQIQSEAGQLEMWEE